MLGDTNMTTKMYVQYLLDCEKINILLSRRSSKTKRNYQLKAAQYRQIKFEKKVSCSIYFLPFPCSYNIDECVILDCRFNVSLIKEI